MPVTKRTGESVLFEWDYVPANESLIDEFRLESSPQASGPFSVVQGGLAPSARSVSKTASSHLFYRLAAVKGSLAAFSVDLAEVVIDDTPPPPDNFRAS